MSKSAFVEGMGHFGAKYKVERLRLPLTSIHCWIGEWFYHNHVAGNFHTNKNFVAKFIRLNLNFIH